MNSAGPAVSGTDGRLQETVDRLSNPGAKEDELEAYCLKCREKREMLNPQPITMKNGKPATNGTCAVCGTKMFKIGKTPAGVA